MAESIKENVAPKKQAPSSEASKNTSTEKGWLTTRKWVTTDSYTCLLSLYGYSGVKEGWTHCQSSTGCPKWNGSISNPKL